MVVNRRVAGAAVVGLLYAAWVVWLLSDVELDGGGDAGWLVLGLALAGALGFAAVRAIASDGLGVTAMRMRAESPLVFYAVVPAVFLGLLVVVGWLLGSLT